MNKYEWIVLTDNNGRQDYVQMSKVMAKATPEFM